jgi:hypothetical protein
MQKTNKFMHKSWHLLTLTKPTLWAIAFLMSTSLLPLLAKPVVAGIPGTSNISFWNPPGTKAPQTSRGGASRDGNSCGFAQTKSVTDSLTPLMPKSNIGLTTKGHPTIFVYLPKSIAKEALFTIKDEKGNKHYQTTLKLPQNPGLMKINVPDSMSELVKGNKYNWSMLLVCGEDIEPDSPFVEGWIERVSPESNNVSQNKPIDIELVKNLGKAGLWLDTMSALVELRQSQPNNVEVAKTWKILLEDKTVGLTELVGQPFIN